MKSPITNTLLMVEPVAFGFNPETAVNNYFQQQDKMSAAEIQRLALAEFSAMVKQLQDKGIHVIVVKDTSEPHTPDSIFPNNWISFHENGRIVIYPMFAENRRKERRREIIQFIVDQGYRISKEADYSVLKKTTAFWKEQAAWRSTGKIKLHTQLCRKEPIKRCFCSFATILGIGPSVFQPIKQLKDSVCRFIIPMSCFA